MEANILAIALAIGAFIISVLTNAFLLRYLRKKNVLDIPNERSSHTQPTPRGGGNGILAGVIIAGGVYAAIAEDYKIALILGLIPMKCTLVSDISLAISCRCCFSLPSPRNTIMISFLPWSLITLAPFSI